MVEVQQAKVRLSFYLILVFLPFFILLLIEIALRAVGYGKRIPLFIEEGAPMGFMQPNPDVIHRYFADKKLAPQVSPDTVYFKKEKPKDSIRVVIQGGSTAAGFPYGRWGSLQGMLDQRFKRLYPDNEIEIINTAMSAVNTYTLLDFVAEIIAQKPDLVMIYAGHNEYLGIMGAGSAFASKGSRIATLTYLKIKDLRLYRIVERVLYLFKSPRGYPAGNERSLMAQAARGRGIQYGSSLYELGVVQFRENLKLILAEYERAGIPVFIGTLASNEKDQVPFSTVGRVDWESYLSNLDNIDLKQEAKSLEMRLSTSESAGDWYKLGHIRYRQKRYDKAQSAFSRAKDLDRLRFRAPQEFNQIIKSQAKKGSAIVVDVKGYIRNDSESGVVGKEHMLEHLHPTTRGYFLLAEAFSDTFLAHATKFDFALGSPHHYPREQAWDDIPVTRIAEQYGQYKIALMTNGYPFTNTPKTVSAVRPENPEKQLLLARINGQSWLLVQQKAVEHYRNSEMPAEAARTAALISDALVTNHAASFLAASFYRDIDDMQMALFYHKRALMRQPDNVRYLLSYAQTYYMIGQLEESLGVLKDVLELDAGNANALYFYSKLLKIKKNQRE